MWGAGTREQARGELLRGAIILGLRLRLQCGELFHLWHHDDVKFRQRRQQLSQINPALEELCLWHVCDCCRAVEGGSIPLQSCDFLYDVLKGGEQRLLHFM